MKPGHVVMRVERIVQTPFYAFHAKTNRRISAGEEVVEYEFYGPTNSPECPGGFKVEFTRSTLNLFKLHGFRDRDDLVGRVLVIETDDIEDGLLPGRIIEIR